MKLKINKKLDLSDVSCPMNFVKTKVVPEELEKGDLLEVILDEGDAILNVPRSVKEDGHQIVKVENLETKFKVLIKKK